MGRRKSEPLPRYVIMRCWDQVEARDMWSVVDRRISNVAKGADPDGYDTEAAAQIVLARLLTELENRA